MGLDIFIEEFILPMPHPADARLRGSGVSVWSLIANARLVAWDLDRLAREYDISAEALRAALAYYKANREVIDARIRLNAG